MQGYDILYCKTQTDVGPVAAHVDGKSCVTTIVLAHSFKQSTWTTFSVCRGNVYLQVELRQSDEITRMTL